MERPMHRPERGLARDPPMKEFVGAQRGQRWRAANGCAASTDPFSRQRRRSRRIRSFNLRARGKDLLRRSVDVGLHDDDGLLTVRVFGCLPVTARGAARRQASEKPRRRKPRGEYAPTAVSVYGEFKARFCATWPLSASFAPPPIMLNPIGSRSVAAPPVFAGELKHLVHVP